MWTHVLASVVQSDAMARRLPASWALVSPPPVLQVQDPEKGKEHIKLFIMNPNWEFKRTVYNDFRKSK